MRALAVIALFGLLGPSGCRPSAGDGTDGKALFEATCAKCHGADGKGDPVQKIRLGVPNMTDPAWQARHTDDDIKRTVRVGSKSHKMPAFGEFYKPPQLDALVRHVRELGTR